MQLLERTLRTHHVEETLAKQPLVSAAIDEARVALSAANALLEAARRVEWQKQQAVKAASKQLVTTKNAAFDECIRAGGLLVAHDAPAETLDASMRGRSPAAIERRANELLTHAAARHVTLGPLEARRVALTAAWASAKAARVARKEARKARLAAEGDWDSAYAALRAAVEYALAKTGLRGRALTKRAQAYFPKHTRARSQRADAAKPDDLPPPQPAD